METQKNNCMGEFFSSDNGLYILGREEFTDDKLNFANFSVYETNGSCEQRAKRACLHAHLAAAARADNPADCNGVVDLKKCSTFIAPFTIGGRRAAISNSGKYAATAAYERKGISLMDCRTGNQLWNTKAVKKVQGVNFSKEEKYVIASNEDEPAHTYYIDILTGEIVKRIVAARVLANPYGEDIVFWHRDTVLIGGKKIKSPTFAYVTACGTPFGIVVSPVNHFPRMYDYDGSLMWKSVTNKDHILAFAYNEEKQIIFGKARDGIVAMNPQNGEIIESYDEYIGGAVFINRANEILFTTGDVMGLFAL